MSSGRSDVQRLFGHFGLDPNDYVSSFSRTATTAATSSPTASAARTVEVGAGRASDRELFDYRNFELSR
jgi:hypothetical protein